MAEHPLVPNTLKRAKGERSEAMPLFGTGPNIDDLMSALKVLGSRGDERVRIQAADALGEMHDARAVDPLIAVLRDPKSTVLVRAAVVEALGKIGDRRAVDPLIGVLRAIHTQAPAGGHDLMKQLQSHAGEQVYAFVRGRAAEALGKIGDRRAIAALTVARQDASEHVRDAAAQALKDIEAGTPSAPSSASTEARRSEEAGTALARSDAIVRAAPQQQTPQSSPTQSQRQKWPLSPGKKIMRAMLGLIGGALVGSIIGAGIEGFVQATQTHFDLLGLLGVTGACGGPIAFIGLIFGIGKGIMPAEYRRSLPPLSNRSKVKRTVTGAIVGALLGAILFGVLLGLPAIFGPPTAVSPIVTIMIGVVFGAVFGGIPGGVATYAIANATGNPNQSRVRQSIRAPSSQGQHISAPSAAKASGTRQSGQRDSTSQGVERKQPSQRGTWQVAYFENPPRRTNGRCSDRSCPCHETPIPRGAGFVYISQELVDFRQDARTFKELETKAWLKSMTNPDLLLSALANPGSRIALSPELVDPILVCEQGARLRKLDLEIAAADAKEWWKSGRSPLRVTPLAGSDAARKERAERGLPLIEQPG